MKADEIKAIEILHHNGIWLQDTLSVLYDLRPCMRYRLNKEKYFLLKKILPSLGLRTLVYMYKEIDKPMCIIGKDKSILKDAYLYDKECNGSELGKLLGYPLCCISFHKKRGVRGSLDPLYSKQNTKTKLNYKLNYIFNFDTRLSNNRELENLHFRGYRDWDKYLIPHIPCSFDCKPSIEYASKLLNIIKGIFPIYAETLERYLKAPVLFISDYEFIVFDGKVNGNTLNYKNIFRINNLTDKNLLNSVLSGNRIDVSEKGVSIFRNDDKIREFEIKAEFFDFSE